MSRLICASVCASVHYNDVITIPMASRFTSLAIVYSTVYSGADQRKHQSCASLAFVRRIHRLPVNSLHKRPATRQTFPFDDVIMGVTTFHWWELLTTNSARVDTKLYYYYWMVFKFCHAQPLCHELNLFFGRSINCKVAFVESVLY